MTDIRAQTFTHSGGVVFYFEVWESPENDAKFSPLKYPSLQEAVQNEHKEFLGTIVEDTINQDLIHPAFNSTGLITFWESFEINLIKPILKIFLDG